MKLSITWLVDAYVYREGNVKKHQKKTFDEFLSMSKIRIGKWITNAKREYLMNNKNRRKI